MVLCTACKDHVTLVMVTGAPLGSESARSQGCPVVISGGACRSIILSGGHAGMSAAWLHPAQGLFNFTQK